MNIKNSFEKLYKIDKVKRSVEKQRKRGRKEERERITDIKNKKYRS